MTLTDYRDTRLKKNHNDCISATGRKLVGLIQGQHLRGCLLEQDGQPRRTASNATAERYAQNRINRFYSVTQCRVSESACRTIGLL